YTTLFRSALRFEQAGNPIVALFVSASAAPGRMRHGSDLQGSDRELLSLVSDVTGANPEFLNDEQFAATILPTLRGLKAVHATGYRSSTPYMKGSREHSGSARKWESGSNTRS